MNIEEYKKYMISVGNFNCEKLSPKSHLVCNGIGMIGTLTFVINSLYLYGDDVEEIYVDMCDWWKKTHGFKDNPYDHILKQTTNSEYIKSDVFGHHFDRLKNINILNDIRKTIKLIKFNDNIMEYVNDQKNKLNIDENSLGVHVRLTDMNHVHGKEYGLVYYEDYVSEIDKILNENNIKNIFASTDNNESLYKLKKRYGKTIQNLDNIYRTEKEDEVYNINKKSIGCDYLNVKNFTESFYDALLLSKCGYIIGRKYSTFRIFSTIFSNIVDDKKIIELS